MVNLNDPGYLDLGAGVTWTPIKDLIVVIHPLNYHFIFSSGVLLITSPQWVPSSWQIIKKKLLKT
jgi:hypothetical protein